MSDGTEEETVEKSTEELLSETDDLLAGMGDGGGGAGSESGASSAGGADGLADLEAGGGVSEGRETQTQGEARTAAGGGDERRFRRYFEPKSAGISAVLVLAGALVGGIVPIPLIGSFTKLLGVFGAAFLHGVTASDSRYAETLVAGGVVGLALAVLTNPILALSGVGVPIVAVSTGLVVLAALVGHYFGRDLRDGLTRDVGGGGGGGGDDVPGW